MKKEQQTVFNPTTRHKFQNRQSIKHHQLQAQITLKVN